MDAILQGSDINGGDEMETQSNADHTSTEGKHLAAPTMGKGKDWWGRLLAALTAATLTGWVTWRVNVNEMRARNIELQSSRETAVQALQGQVFDTFSAHVARLIEDPDSKKIVMLAALHSNFNEFFDMRTVLEIFARKTEDLTARHELMRLVKKVARRQAEFIKSHPGESESEKHYNMSETVDLIWPAKSGEKKKLIEVGPHIVTVFISSEPIRKYSPVDLESLDMKKVRSYMDEGDWSLDDVNDQVEVGIILMGESSDFTVSYMDSPYMDNFWMTHPDGTHGRLAIRLKDIDTIDEDGIEFSIKLEVLHFPSDFFTPMERRPAKDFE